MDQASWTAAHVEAFAFFGGAPASILVQRVDSLPDGADLARIGFLVPDLARPYLHSGAELLVMEGPKIVAHAVVRELLPAY